MSFGFMNLCQIQELRFVIAKQLIRSGTSIGANHRAACRAKSTSDFIAKMGIAEEECDESRFWMEILIESGIIEAVLLKDLLDEADQLSAITVKSIKTAKMHRSSN
jgi:four helix bundle protein